MRLPQEVDVWEQMALTAHTRGLQSAVVELRGGAQHRIGQLIPCTASVAELG